MKVNYLLLLKDAWLVICILGNVYQVIQISELFFRYDAVTIVNIDFPVHFKSSAFTICLYTIDIIRWPEVLEQRPELKRQLAADNVSLENIESTVKTWSHDLKVIYDSLLVNEQNATDIFKLTLDENDIFFNCTYLSNETYLIEVNPNCSEVFNIRPFFKECFKCFTFNNINDTTYKYSTTMKAIGKNGFVSSIKIRDEIIETRSENAPVFFSVSKTIPRSSSSVFITPLYQTVQLTIDAYESVMLPAPYISKCIDYNLQGLTGDDHCYECCARNDSVKVFNGSLFPGPCLTLRCKDNMMSIYSIIKDGNSSENNKNQLMLDIQKRCQTVCRFPHCNKKIVIPSIMSTNVAEDNIFITYVQQTPDILTTFIPTLDVIEYLTQVSSTFGVWAGLSFFSFYDLFIFVKSKTQKDRPELGSDHQIRPTKTPIKSGIQQSNRKIISKNVSNLRLIRGTGNGIINLKDDGDWIAAEKTLCELGTRKPACTSVHCIECSIRGLLKLRNNKMVSTRNGMSIGNRKVRTRRPNYRGQSYLPSNHHSNLNSKV